MPDKSQNLVHLRWLLKLIDFRAVGELSWGSTVLATLLSLTLQSWAQFRFPFLHPRVDHPYTFPHVKRWNHLLS
ncbi:hypothetical protein Golax_005299 [Gossypium laxum]|uniref:Aminotransferase-like plant mobile domain-containing protein n=1 Tax=Gossypium laxum TaxID=34288 RepID=A0A7J9A0G4_9ROSI|nr:hypothetical protein [Gossypium laxum]